MAEQRLHRGGSDPSQGDPVALARNTVLRQLTTAPRSRAELARALARRGVPDDVAEQVLDRFTEVDLIDDAAYAEVLVRSKQTTRGLARRALAHELRTRGVGAGDAEAALAQVDDETELATARALVARRLPATARLAPEVRQRRLAGMLARKGYSSGVALQVVREALRGGDALEDATADVALDD